MKKIIALAIFASFFGVNLVSAQTTTSTTSTDPVIQPNPNATSTKPPKQLPPSQNSRVKPTASGTLGIGKDVSTINKEAEEQIKLLRREMEARIKALKSEYEMRIKAIRDAAKKQAEEVRAQNKLENNQKKSTSTRSGFLLRLLGRD